MDNISTLMKYLETTVSENNVSLNNNSTSENNMTAVGGAMESETSETIMTTEQEPDTSKNNMTAVGGAMDSETSGKNDTTNKSPDNTEVQEGGFLSSIFAKSSNDSSALNKLNKLLETTQVNNTSNISDTAVLEQKLREILGGKKN